MTGSTHHYGFIGLGLIGGSIARSLKTIQPDCRITAYSRSRAPLEHALSDGSIDVIADNISREYFGICDYIFLCTPVKYISSYLEQLAQCIGSNCIITDVGSVKGYVHESVEALGLTASFIGGHPMAGSEKTGYDNSDASILRGAYYFITPTKDSPDDRLTEYEGLVSAMGSIPVITDCQTHDHTVAAISHLPHLVASSLVNLVKDSDNPEQLMKLVAAGGFKDITRIASSSPEMWEQICQTNSDAILSLLDDYIASLQDIRSNIAQHSDGYVYRLFEKSRDYRDSFGK